MFPRFYPHLYLLRGAERIAVQGTLYPTGFIIGDPPISLRFEITPEPIWGKAIWKRYVCGAVFFYWNVVYFERLWCAQLPFSVSLELFDALINLHCPPLSVSPCTHGDMLICPSGIHTILAIFCEIFMVPEGNL